ncbi:MAG: hypothetical protein WAV21_02190 [Minisyncoccia bacterium]
MSRTSLLVSAAIILVLIGAVCWFWKGSDVSFMKDQKTDSGFVSGSSDEALDQNLGAIDAHINSFSSDNATIDQSFSDQPVEQSTI